MATGTRIKYNDCKNCNIQLTMNNSQDNILCDKCCFNNSTYNYSNIKYKIVAIELLYLGRTREKIFEGYLPKYFKYSDVTDNDVIKTNTVSFRRFCNVIGNYHIQECYIYEPRSIRSLMLI